MNLTPIHAKYYANQLVRKISSDSIEKFASTLVDARVDLNPHQIDAALFAFKSPLSKGAILADEVGLGKTIEAGIVLCQKWAENKRRILLIVPSNLRKQWYQELLDKFFLDSVIIESKNFNEMISKDIINPFEQKKIVICSYHFAKNKEDYIKKICWDLAVIDEAHRLRNVHHNSNKIAKSIKSSLDNIPKLLLTATPLQNSLIELYSLVSFIDDFTFGDLSSFKDQFSRLNDDSQVNFTDLKERLSTICKRTLRKQVIEYIKYTNRISITQEFTPNEDEQKLYDLVSKYLQKEKLYALPSGQRHLMTLIMRRLLASSTFAITGTFNSLIEKMNYMLKTGQVNSLRDYVSKDYELIDELSDEWNEEDLDSQVGNKLTIKEKEELQKEIGELKEYVDISKNITNNAKGDSLIIALRNGFSKLKELGAPQKALIFTEFKRTQEYLFNILSNTEFKGKIVLFNGSNNNDQAKEIYTAWLEKNQGTNKVTGSKSADTRAAILDYFKNEASIMIATEAAAEGINLQFCSLVVNYDLPWNPQRVEQRIGRCHRYGQNFDVVVINFLNIKNEADKRVYELLSEKFKLFSGVFGASDEILGTIESGVDFEKRIAQIYQECRTKEEIKNAFDELQKELESQINKEMSNTRKKLLDNFDEEVHERLRTNLHESKEYINNFEKMLWDLTKFKLNNDAEFNEKDYSFKLKKNPYPISIPTGEYKLSKNTTNEYIYRINHPLAQKIINEYKNNNEDKVEIEFDYTNNPSKISILNELKNKTGELILYKINITSFEEEEYLIFSGVTTEGKIINEEQCKKLFNISGKIINQNITINNSSILEEEFVKKQNEIITKISEKNEVLFDNESEKLEKWASDKRNGLKVRLKDIDEQVKVLKKEIRENSNLQEKLKKQRSINELDKKRDNEWRKFDDEIKEINKEKDKLIDKVESRMKQEIRTEKIFKIKWRVK
jgi:superfamily II DNA/RNA helicase